MSRRWPRRDGLRTLALAEPGPVRQWLTGLVIDGRKTATAQRLLCEYEEAGEALERPGERVLLLDDDGNVAAQLEVTRAEAVAFAEVTDEFVAAEGEDFAGHGGWAAVHRPFFERAGRRVRPDTLVACVWFEVVRPEDVG